METISILGGIAALAFLVERLVELILGLPFEKLLKLAPWRWVLTYAAAAFGIGIAFAYHLDIIALLLPLPETQVGYILTGLIIGCGSEFTHQVIKKFKEK